MSGFLTIDDLLGLNQVGDAQLHPDGNLVTFTVSSSVGEYKDLAGTARIWLTGTEQTSRALVDDGIRSHHPRWSPDGETLCFLGRRKDEKEDEIYALDQDWVGARRLTELRAGVKGFVWSPDSSKIAILSTDPPPEDEDDRKKRGYDQVEYEKLDRFDGISLLSPSNGETTRLTHHLQVYEYVWSPDGSQIAAIVADKPYGWAWYSACLVRIDVASGMVTNLFTPDRQLTCPAWSPDGNSISVICSTFSDQGMTGGDIFLIDTESGACRNLTENHLRSYLSLSWSPDGSTLFAPAYEDAEATLCRLDLDGNCEALWRDKATLNIDSRATVYHSDGSARVAVVRADLDNPGDVWTVDVFGQQVTWNQLTDLNPDVGKRSVWRVESLHWESFDGQTIQGILLRPNDRLEAGPLPMITLIHGGPTGVHGYDFPSTRSTGWAHLLAARGYAVLLPNPRGSMGFGLKFAEANIDDLGGGDMLDILTGVDHCVEMGYVDPQRLGVGGWSYGGYLTPWAITRTTRFKAAVSGASITNWTSFHGVSTIQGFDETYNRTNPYNADGFYTFRSPVYNVDGVETPTLFLHGEKDPICPVGQAYEMYRALKDRGVETELVVYPREHHGIREREHVRDLLERVVDWFGRRV